MDFSAEIKDFLLYCVRLGIWKDREESLSCHSFQNKIDWNHLQDIAAKQGLSAVMVDGIERLPDELRPPKIVLLQWIGETLQGYEYRYELYRRAIAEMAAFYNQHGFKMMVLKGYACSLDWPKPEHRPCGDIDIWQFGVHKKADTALSKEKGIEIDNSHHHTVFLWRDFMVENHYDFVNVYAHKSSRELERVLKQLGEDDSHFLEVYGEKVYLPSPNLHALFLIRHDLNHFASSGINLRQVLDWGFFVKAHGKDVDWNWLLGILEKYKMKEFFNCINAICVEDLGFDSSLFNGERPGPTLKEKVLKDILELETEGSVINGLLPRLIYRFRRWKSNAWKQDLCFTESRIVSLGYNMWSKLLKPASFGRRR